MSFAASLPHPINADRFGVIASALCAIHCAVTPFLLILLPTFGKIWSHPATHWGMALIVVPIAVIMLKTGYRRHRRKWVVVTGVVGVVGVLVGAAIPYLEKPPVTSVPSAGIGTATNSEDSEVFVWNAGDAGEETEPEVFVWTAEDGFSDASECVDSCCPSFQTDENGNTTLHVPLASIVTTLGGLALIMTHLGNLCCCRGCRRENPEL